jgi:hypothetical protein
VLAVLRPSLPLFLLAACSSNQLYPQNPLAREILRPRPNHTNKLTNEACLNRDKGVCTSWALKEYDVTDPAVRSELNGLGFTCKVAGKRYHVCMDQPGFCRFQDNYTYFLGIVTGSTRSTTFLPIAPYQVVLDSDVKCFNESFYDYNSVQ